MRCTGITDHLLAGCAGGGGGGDIQILKDILITFNFSVKNVQPMIGLVVLSLV